MKLIISGTTGVGKSTTVNLVKEHYKKLGKEVKVLSELVIESPFFDLFYDNLEGWSFLAQIEFVLGRFKQWVAIEDEYADRDPSEYVIIYDRHFIEDLVFAELKNVRDAVPSHLTNAYKDLYNMLIEKIDLYEKPDFFVLLKASFDTVAERQFDKRGREQEINEENNIDNKFWQDLYYRYYASKRYRNIFKENTKNFVEIDTDDCSPEKVLNKVIKYIEKRFEIK